MDLLFLPFALGTLTPCVGMWWPTSARASRAERGAQTQFPNVADRLYDRYTGATP